MGKVGKAKKLSFKNVPTKLWMFWLHLHLHSITRSCFVGDHPFVICSLLLFFTNHHHHCFLLPPNSSGLGRKQDNDGAAEPIRWEDISLGRLPKLPSAQWIGFGLPPPHSEKPKLFCQGKGLWNQQGSGNMKIFVFVCLFNIYCVIV